MFAFYVDLWYEILIQYHCICIHAYDVRWNLDTVMFCGYPECNAKVKLRKMAPKFGLFFSWIKMAKNTLYNRARALRFGE